MPANFRDRSRDLVFCLLGLTAMAANAQTESDLLTEAAYLDDPGMVLTGSRLRQAPGDSPVSVTVIDREMIEASGVREIQELLRLVPGMVLTYSFGHWPTVSMGFGAESYSRRIEVLVDGRSVYTPTFGGVPWPSLPYSVSDIQRIEVTRGPNAASFGTNAFLGTINIITRDPADRDGGELEILAGDDFVNRLQVRQFGSTENTDWRVSAAQWGDNGFHNRRREGDGKSHRFINGHMRYQTDDRGILHFRGGYETGAHEFGRSGTGGEPPHKQYWSNTFGQVNWEYRTDGNTLVDLQLQHSQETTEERFLMRQRAVMDFTDIIYDESRASERTDLELQLTRSPSTNTRVLWGLGLREDVVHSEEAYFRDGPASNTFARAFGQLEWQPGDKYVANLSAMVENDELGGTSFSPRLGLNFHPDTHNTFRIAASRAHRSPVLIAEYGDWWIEMPGRREQIVTASGSLDRETVDSIEIGHLYRSADDRFRIDTRLHRDRLQNLIMYIYVPSNDDTFNGTTIDLDNTDDAWITGLETGLTYRTREGAQLTINYAYKDIDSTDNAVNISDSTPTHNISMLGLYPLTGQTDISFKYFRYSPYNILDLQDGADTTERLDLRLAHHLGPKHDSPRLALVVQSVTGSYEESRPRNRFDRRVFGEIRIPF